MYITTYLEGGEANFPNPEELPDNITPLISMLRCNLEANQS